MDSAVTGSARSSGSSRVKDLGAATSSTSASSARDTKSGSSTASAHTETGTFLHKHSSGKLHDHNTGELFRARSSSGDLKGVGSSDHFSGGHDGHHGDHHGGHHHGHHHGHDHFSLFLGFGYPFYGYGFYDPWFYGPYSYGYYGGFYPGFGFSYHSRHFGIGVGLPLYGYGYGWPYYGYEPVCAYPPTAYVESPGYVAAPGVAARIDANPPAVATDGSPRRPEALPAPDATDKSAVSASGFARDGEQAFKKGDYKAAIGHWRHALLDDPKNGTLVMMLAQAMFATGEFDEAAGATQAAMRMMPDDKWGVVVANYVELYGNAQDYVDQWKVLEKAAKEKPDDPALRFLLGFHYGFMGYPVEAKRELDKLVELAPKDQLGRKLRDMMAEKVKEKEPKDEATP